MADESKREHPRSNAVHRQRALGAIRMRPIHASWLTDPRALLAETPAPDRGLARKPTGR